MTAKLQNLLMMIFCIIFPQLPIVKQHYSGSDNPNTTAPFSSLDWEKWGGCGWTLICSLHPQLFSVLCTHHTARSSQPAWVWRLPRPALTLLPPRHGTGCLDRGSPEYTQWSLGLLLFCGWQTSKIWELFKSWILTQETRIIMILSNYPGIHKFHFTQQI